MAEALLKVCGLKKHFGENRVLDGVDLAVAEASVTTVIGKSGMGKSVLLKCIAGLLTSDSGEVWFDGKPLEAKQMRAGKGAALGFSYMFQGNALFDSLTAAENVALPLREGRRIKGEELKARVDGLLERMDLRSAANQYPGELSGGMQKRVAFARALILEPRIVLFDEPTTGLDPERKFGVFDLISEYRRDFGFTALLVSHDIPEVFDISDRVAWLDQGIIRFDGKPSEINDEVETALAGFLKRRKSLASRT